MLGHTFAPKPVYHENSLKILFALFYYFVTVQNDIIRKRFDGVKYDLKKIEEVVHHVSIRKLAPSPATTTAPGMATATSMQQQNKQQHVLHSYVQCIICGVFMDVAKTRQMVEQS